MAKRVQILDCTLRDGGYVNNWEFDNETAKKIISSIYNSGIRYIEIGILGNGCIAGKSTKFSTFDEMRPLLEERKPDCHYAVMINQAEASKFVIPPKSEDTVDIIRLAYFKRELKDALTFACELKEKGYTVFLQAMATFMYSDTELKDMIEEINRIKPAAFYMVDSFSNMYPGDIELLENKILRVLSPEIEFGFHAHNNLQLAFANVLAFISTETNRTLFVDGSIYGMGRGAGNVPVELLMEYLNKEKIQFDISYILEAFQNYLKPVFHQFYWGYAHPYFLTAAKDMNSVYSWYLGNNGIADILMLNKALDAIPEECKYTLMRGEADRILAGLQEGSHDI